MPVLQLYSPTTRHLPQVVELDRLCLGGIWTLDGYQRELDSSSSHLQVLSVPVPQPSTDGDRPEPAEQIIACSCFWSILEEAHITLLMVHPDYRGQGLGQFMLYALFRAAVERKLERATLEVREFNREALSLYQKFGFQALGRRKGYYAKTGEDAMILWRGDLHRPEFAEQLARWQDQIGDRLHRHHWQIPDTDLDVCQR